MPVTSHKLRNGKLIKAVSFFRTIFFILLIVLPALTACSTPAPSPSAAIPSTAAPPTQAPTSTPTPSPTATHTPTPTATPTPTPTFTPTPSLFVLPETPLPASLDALTEQNAAQVSGLAEWQEAPVTDLAWTPDGQFLAVAGPGTISLYETQNREKVRALYPKAADIVDITFRPDGGWLVSASRLGSEQEGFGSNLELWQGPFWRPFGILYGTQRGLSSLAFSGDGKTLLTAYASPEIEYQSSLEFWDTSTWEITTTITTGTVLNMAVSPDGLLLATSPDRYAISIRDLRENEVLHNLPTSFTGAVNSLVFSPNGSLLASGHYDGAIRLWNVQTGELLVTMDAEEMGVVESLAFNPQGNLLASGHSYQDNLVRLWSAASGELLRTLEGHQHAVDHLLFSPDGQVLVSGSYDGTLRLWGIRQ